MCLLNMGCDCFPFQIVLFELALYLMIHGLVKIGSGYHDYWCKLGVFSMLALPNVLHKPIQYNGAFDIILGFAKVDWSVPYTHHFGSWLLL
jgi:hypothetical protein